MLKVLITAPAHTTRGGVTSYYMTLREHLSEEIKFFVAGDRFLGTPDSENVVRRIIRLLMDYFHFVAILWSSKTTFGWGPALSYSWALRLAAAP